LETKQRKTREFERLEVDEKSFEFLKTSFTGKKLHVSANTRIAPARSMKFLAGNSIMLVTESNYKPENGTITAYGLLDNMSS